MTEGGELPVEHGDDREVAVQHDVVDVVVAVDEVAGAAVNVGRHGGAEAAVQLGLDREGVLGGRVGVLGVPAAQLPLDVAVGAAEVAESSFLGRRRVDEGEGLEEVAAGGARRFASSAAPIASVRRM